MAAVGGSWGKDGDGASKQLPWGSPTWGLVLKFCPLPLPSPWIQGCSKCTLYFYTLEKLLNFLSLKTPLPQRFLWIACHL